MSKGLSKLQKTILGLLDNSLPGSCYRWSGTLTTRELLHELIIRGMISRDSPKKSAMATIRRACMSLLERGHIEGEYDIDSDYPWATIVSWRLATRNKPSADDSPR